MKKLSSKMPKASGFSILLMCLLFTIVFSNRVNAQLFTEDFTGLTTASNLSSQNSWSNSGTYNVTVQNTSPITYSGYAMGGGNYAQAPAPASANARVVHTYTTTTMAANNTFYYSFLVNFSATTATGEYFMSLADASASSNHYARLYAKTGSVAGKVVLGITKNGGTAVYGATDLDLNTTYLVVCRYTATTIGTLDDNAYIWVNPSLASEPAVGTAYASQTGAAGTDAGTSWATVVIHQRTGSNSPTYKMDGLRVAFGTTAANAWTALSPAPAAPVLGSPTAVVNYSTATLGATVTASGGALSAGGIVWSTSDVTPTIGEPGVTQVASATPTVSTPFTAFATGLSPETLVYWSAYATNPTGTTYTTPASFTTGTQLAIGDLSVLAINSNGNDVFSFVTWKALGTNTIIKFTDNSFLSASSSTTASNVRGGEGFVVWTNSGSTIPAGTVISVDPGLLTASTGTVSSVSGSYAIANAGDQLFAYQGTSTAAASAFPDFASNANPTTFSGTLLFGIQFPVTWITTGSASTALSYLPSDINSSSGNIALVSGSAQLAQFNTSISKSNQTTFAAYRTLTNSAANWTFATTGTVVPNTTAFTLCTPNTAGAGSSTPTVCINTALPAAITHTTTGATGISNDGVSGANGLPAGVSATWASNTISINGTPTASGTFNYIIPLTGGCNSAVNATGTITVTANNIAGIASSTPTICFGLALPAAITHTTTGATGISNDGVSGANGLPGGVSATWAANTITINGTPTASGTFNYSIPLTGGCGAINATGTITVTATNTAGAASSTPTVCFGSALPAAITHTTTGATGISNDGVSGANGLPGGVSATWAANTITINGTPTASGTFNYSISLTGGCGSVNATGTITVSTNTFTGTGNFTDGTKWSCGSAPASGDNFTVDGGAVLTTNFTIGGTMNIGTNGGLYVAPGATLTVSGTANFNSRPVVFQSSAAGYGSLGQVTGAVNGADNVTVERFIPNNGFRSWRLLSVPTSGGQSINAAWQNGQSPLVVGQAGMGTLITGPGGGNGLDAAAPLSSLLRWNGTGWTGVNNMNDAISNFKGYFMYVRGDRNKGVTGLSTDANATTLSTTGTIYTGNQPTTVPTNALTLVGNVYPSAIDFTGLGGLTVDAGATGVIRTFYIWDSKKQSGNSLGVYQTFSSTSVPAYAPQISGGSYTVGVTSTTIESGQAFLVRGGTSSGGSLVLQESAKISGTNGNLGFRPSANPAYISSRLYNNNGEMADANQVVFDAAYSNAVDGNDAVKLTNPGENFAIQKENNIVLAVEGRQPIENNDVVQFKLWNLQQQAYRFEFILNEFTTPGLTATVVDRYLGTSTAVNMNGTTEVNFTVTADVNSSSADRFYVLFRQQAPLPVTFVSVSGNRTAVGVKVDWKVTAEQNINTYSIERSSDGRNFTATGNVTATGSSAEHTYSYTDAQAPSTLVYYRIKSTGTNGEVKYSVTVMVNAGKGKAGFSISPNPVQNSVINLQFLSQAEGRYSVRLLSTTGAVLSTEVLTHTGGSSTQTLNLPSYIAKGAYQLEITAPDKTRTVQTVIVDKK